MDLPREWVKFRNVNQGVTGASVRAGAAPNTAIGGEAPLEVGERSELTWGTLCRLETVGARGTIRNMVGLVKRVTPPGTGAVYVERHSHAGLGEAGGDTDIEGAVCLGVTVDLDGRHGAGRHPTSAKADP